MVRTFPQFSYHFCPFYNASVLTERLRFAILRAVQMSGDHRHQRPLTSLEKQDSWLSGLFYHVIFFSDLYIAVPGDNRRLDVFSARPSPAGPGREGS